MKNTTLAFWVFVAAAAAAAEPSVLEIGYKAPEQRTEASPSVSLGQILSEMSDKSAKTPAQDAAAEPAAENPAPAAEASAVEKPAVEEKVVTNIVEKVIEKPVVVEKVVTNVVEKVVEKPVVEEKVVTNVVEKVVEKPVVEEKVVTNVVEKVVEKRVADPELEAKNTDLSEDNEQLRKDLAEERAKLAKLERALPKEAKQLTGRPAKITSDSTIYNRKEGIASFEGHVYVDDEQYQMHADRVYLFMEGTNELKRIVAIGNVAMTNEARRAYGAKATYSKKNGLVVLYSGDGITAEVRDESKVQDQIVRGKRIRFWIGTEQVEVDEADLTGAAPSGGTDSLKKALGK